MRIFFLIVILMVLFHFIGWFWADRQFRRLPRAGLWRSLLALFMGALALYPVGMFLFTEQARQAHHWVPTPAMSALYLWYIMILPIWIVTLGIGGLIYGGFSGARWALRSGVDEGSGFTVQGSEAPSLSPGDGPRTLNSDGLSRREVLGVTAAAAPIVLTAAGAGWGTWQINHFRIRRMTLNLPQLPPALDGMTLAHVSDVHVGRYTYGRQLRAIAEATNQLRADLVVLTGDLIDMSLADLPSALDMVHRLDPRHGLMMCEGNHDLIEDGRAFVQGVRASGVPLLVNESQVFNVRGEPVQLLGARWERGEDRIIQAMHQLTPMRDPEAFPILLAHHPHVFDVAAAAGLPLTLAGHTHGGQLMLNERMGAGYVLFRYISGHYRRGESSMVVSNGVGNWFPLRVNAPAEIIHLTLRRGVHGG